MHPRALAVLCFAAAAPRAVAVCLEPPHAAWCAAAPDVLAHAGTGKCAAAGVGPRPCARGLDEWQVTRALAGHNAHRAHHGACPLTYSEDLEYAVLSSAGFRDSCSTGHAISNAGEPGWGYGENILRWRAEDGRADTFDPQYATWRWYCEEEGCVDWGNPAAHAGGDFAELATMLRKGTTAVGCGVCHVSTTGTYNTVIFTCAYGPAGGNAASFAASVGGPGETAACEGGGPIPGAPVSPPEINAPPAAAGGGGGGGSAGVAAPAGDPPGLVAAVVIVVIVAVALWCYIGATFGLCAGCTITGSGNPFEDVREKYAAGTSRRTSLGSALPNIEDADTEGAYAKLDELPTTPVNGFGNTSRLRAASNASRGDLPGGRSRGESFAADKSEALLSSAYMPDGRDSPSPAQNGDNNGHSNPLSPSPAKKPPASGPAGDAEEVVSVPSDGEGEGMKDKLQTFNFPESRTPADTSKPLTPTLQPAKKPRRSSRRASASTTDLPQL